MVEDEVESGLKNETYQETATLVLAIANTTFKKSGHGRTQVLLMYLFLL